MLLFGFNHQLRFNPKTNNFNIPKGKYYWSKQNEEKYVNYSKSFDNRKVNFNELDFENFVNEIINNKKIVKEKTIFYFDPPYLITNATYNTEWDIEKESKLLNLLFDLDKAGYKWILSNILVANNKKNVLLNNFILDNGYKEISINVNYKNSNYQKKSKNLEKEIVLKNFKYEQN